MKRIICLVLSVILICSSFCYSSADTTTSTRAIVIIPGMLGSELETTSGTQVWMNFVNYSQMALNEDGSSTYSIRSRNYGYGAYSIYKKLYDSLNDAFGSNFDIIFFDYDFRMNNSTAATQLTNELSSYNEVVLVAHSMGGLVASKFLASSASNRAKTVALITLGTPFLGAAKCINAMETGEMITIPGVSNFYIFKNTIKQVGRNSYAGYQLLPTNSYYSKLGIYPLVVNGVNYSSCYNQLKNTSWGINSSGNVKPMFNAAVSFHAALTSGGTYIINNSAVTAYTLSGNGIDTIKQMKYDSSYNVLSTPISNVGDGTVLKNSAGYGNPSYSYSNVNHMDLIKNTTVINRIKTIITTETGFPAAKCMDDLTDNIGSNGKKVVEYNGSEIHVNEKGWIVGEDNKRITITTSNNNILYYENEPTIIKDESVFSHENVYLGAVWNLGSTGKVFYTLYNNDGYSVYGDGDTIISFMDAGYYESVYKCSSTCKTTVLISDYDEKYIDASFLEIIQLDDAAIEELNKSE